MNIIDAVIIIVLILGAMSGIRRGFIKEIVLLVGFVAILVLSFYLKTPVSTFLYKNLPFVSFGGIFKGVSAINILLYEVIAFLLVFSILYLILRIVLKVTGLIEKILKATIVLGFFSKIAGAIVGVIEGYIIVFIVLFILKQPFLNISGFEESKMANTIIEKTPIMSDVVVDANKIIGELYDLSKIYSDDNNTFNEETINLLIKYNIISEENINLLREKGKIE